MNYKMGRYYPTKTKRTYNRKNQFNKTYRKGKTKATKETEKQIEKFLILSTIAIYLFAGAYNIVTATRIITIEGGSGMVSQAVKQAPLHSAEGNDNSPSAGEVDYENIPYMTKKEVRETTMYNAGDPFQCDNTPCISASGDNICMMLAQGINVCAANWLPIGTKIEVEGLGECIVLDKMAKRFSHRVDWAMQAHEKPEAIAFGLKRLEIKILN